MRNNTGENKRGQRAFSSIHTYPRLMAAHHYRKVNKSVGIQRRAAECIMRTQTESSFPSSKKT